MSEDIFKNRKADRQKLLAFGFEATARGYVYRTDFVGGQMTLIVTADADRKLQTAVTDKASGDEYVLHLIAGAEGAFVGRVRTEYEALLEEIAARCFDIEVFKSAQARAVIDYVSERYSDAPEFLWQKFPDNAVVRRKDNRKWYAALLTVSRRKLGFESDEIVEILDLRMPPEDISSRVDGIRYLPGYHMNKRHWITLCLDGSLPNEELFARIDESYALAGKSR